MCIVYCVLLLLNSDVSYMLAVETCVAFMCLIHDVIQRCIIPGSLDTLVNILFVAVVAMTVFLRFMSTLTNPELGNPELGNPELGNPGLLREYVCALLLIASRMHQYLIRTCLRYCGN
jgi:hypothetical protein